MSAHPLTASLSRRSLLIAGAAGGALLGLPPLAAAAPSGRPFAEPFTLGIASGDPTAHGVVLWTRLAPRPFDPDGGMPNRAVDVAWRVFDREVTGSGQRVVAEGVAPARPDLGHSVHVEVTGLAPRRDYWYQFQAGPYRSELGRFRTAPALAAPVSALGFAFVSCQNFGSGFFNSYKDMLDRDLDLVVHLGDYIYEGNLGARPAGRGVAVPDVARPEPMDLAQYRYRHALYKSDEHLRAAHRDFAFAVTWDDHEVENNWQGTYDRAGGSGPEWEKRKAAAFQAYYEHMPLRRPATGASLPLYRELSFGSLLTFHMIDTRQYRDRTLTCPPEERVSGYCSAVTDPQRTILGDEQEASLHEGLVSSATTWNALGNQIRFSPEDNAGDPDNPNFVGGGDQWDGYTADRQALQDLFGSGRVSNPVVITGDQHQNFVYDVPASSTDMTSKTVATEFMGTSISSSGNQTNPKEWFSEKGNPHMVWHNNERGYVNVTVTPNSWTSEFRVALDVTDPEGAFATRRTFVVEEGRPGAQLA